MQRLRSGPAQSRTSMMGFIPTTPCGCALQMHAARAAATSPAPVDKLSALLNSKIFARASPSQTRVPSARDECVGRGPERGEQLSC